MTPRSRLEELFSRYLRRRCTPEEVEELVALLQQEDAAERLSGPLQELWEQIKREQKIYPVDWRQMYRRVTLQQSPRPRIRLFYATAAAAAVAVLLAGGWLLWSGKKAGTRAQPSASLAAQALPVQPGGNKAVLTLAGGKNIVLDDASDGTVATQGGSHVVKMAAGVLAYAAGSKGDLRQVIYNTLATPRGGQYQLRLPDGTRVWLNSASSIRYPTSFTGTERLVSVTGEAYFEVATDAAHPFIVTAGNIRVQVLGTHFNLNAYSDEAAVRTTLVEGSVRIQSLATDGTALVMKPGQQAALAANGGMSVKKADVNEVLGWKNGLFVFHRDELTGVMRRLSRWYDVQVAYSGGSIPESHFTGTIRRSEPLAKVLHMLELTGGVRFKVEGRKIIVSL
jgi:ferric-dicitrate binding protein FerR (iron transport regulator)